MSDAKNYQGLETPGNLEGPVKDLDPLRLNQHPAYNKLIHVETAFQIEENNVAGKVKGGGVGP